MFYQELAVRTNTEPAPNRTLHVAAFLSFTNFVCGDKRGEIARSLIEDCLLPDCEIYPAAAQSLIHEKASVEFVRSPAHFYVIFN